MPAELPKRQPLSAKFLNDVIDDIGGNHQVRTSSQPIGQTALGQAFDREAVRNGFWAKISNEPLPATYNFREQQWNGGSLAFEDVPGGIVGSGKEVNGVTGLTGKIVWIPNIEGDYAFVWHWYNPGCDLIFCVAVWSSKAYCDLINAGDGPTFDCTKVPGGISGATVTIKHVKPDGVTEVAFDSGTTNADGFYCPTVGPLIEDPTVAPTVNPVGGGTAGGDLQPGTYVCAYAWLNDWGSTKLSPRTSEFQVGIPNANQYPKLVAPATPVVTLAAGGLLAPGNYRIKAVFVDAAGKHNLATTNSATVTVANLGDVWTFNLPALALRTYATAIDIYMSSGGFYYLYKSGIVGGTVSLDAAFAPVTLEPATNTSDLNIPTVTLTLGGDETKAFAIRQAAVGVDELAFSVTTTINPVDILHPNLDTLPTRNSTGDGIYRVTVSKGDCDGGPCDTFINTDCGAYFQGVQLCCYELVLNGINADTAGSVDIGTECEAGEVHNVGNCLMPLCPGPEAPTPPADCGLLFSGLHCTITKADYLDRCLIIERRCDVPTDVSTYSVQMYPEATWVNQPGCGCDSTDPATRPKGILPKTLHVSILGPEALTGSAGPVSVTVNYDAASSSTLRAVYVSDCMSDHVGWGWCQPQPTGSEHCYYKDNANPCEDAYGNRNWTNIGNPFIPTKVFYQSSKVTVVFDGTGDSCDPGKFLVTANWHNYWNPSCPGTDPAPSCGWGIPDVKAFPAWPCSYLPCDCGQDPPDSLGLIRGYYKTQDATAVQCTECVSEVNISGSGILDGLYADCVPEQMTFTLTE